METASETAEAKRTLGQRAAVVCLRHVMESWRCVPLCPRSWTCLAMASRLSSYVTNPEWSERDRQRQGLVEVCVKMLCDAERKQVSQAAFASRCRKQAAGTRAVSRVLVNLGYGIETVDEVRKSMLRCVHGAWLHNRELRASPGPLFLAVVGAGRADVVRIMIEFSREGGQGGLQVSLLTEALHVASKASHVEVLRVLLSAGANPDDIRNVETWTDEGVSPLMRAAIAGDIAISESILDAKADVDFCRAGDKFTALHYACQRGQLNIVRLLLDRDANPMRPALGSVLGPRNAFDFASEAMNANGRWGIQPATARLVIRELEAAYERRQRERKRKERANAE